MSKGIELAARMGHLPPYVFARVNQMKNEARSRGADVIDLGMGNPDLPAHPDVTRALVEALGDASAHRYTSHAVGIPELRAAMARHYERRHGVRVDPETEVVQCVGSKEGLGHLILALLGPGDTALVPGPCYPVHFYGVLLSGATPVHIPLEAPEPFLAEVDRTASRVHPRPKVLFLNYPHNPTARTVEAGFFAEVVRLARRHGFFVVHDFAYAEIGFDGYRAPSFLATPGAREVGVEFYSLSKTFHMAGWRVGFCLGNREAVAALGRIKAYYDYGSFIPVQRAAIRALDAPDETVREAARVYQGRRDVLVRGLREAGWPVETPRASMYVWAELPAAHRQRSSLEFITWVLEQSQVVLSPGTGFGPLGEGSVRIAMVEDEGRIAEATRRLGRLLRA